MEVSTRNSWGVSIGRNGYVLCLSCGKETQEISREVTAEFAYCLQHRPSQQLKERIMKEPKAKKVRVAGSGSPAIKWFQEQAASTQDPDKIRAAAEKQDYSANTISIQLGRLRGMGLLPALLHEEKPEKVRAIREPKEKKAKTTFTPVPKPGKKVA